ncbi:MAG: pectate lyase [Halobacteriaceae archaeon]
MDSEDAAPEADAAAHSPVDDATDVSTGDDALDDPTADATDAADRHGTLDRRTLLALAASGVGGLAGCGGGSGDGTTTPPDDTSTTTVATTATTTAPAATSTTTPPTTEPTTTSTTTRPTTVSYDADPVIAPSSDVSPGAGFASADWLAEPTPAVLPVTTLDAAGEGSLRWALERSGPRIVVFEVGGVIDLGTEPITATDGRLYVAGQTAPSPGVTVIRGKVVVDADDAVVQHLRVRPGGQVSGPTDALSVGTSASNVIFDHCTATWGSDEVMSTGGSTENHTVTLTNNVIAEAIERFDHAKGSLVMNDARRVLHAGNLLADNKARNPRLKGGTTTVVANNWATHYEAAITMGGDSDTRSRASVVGNRWERGPDKRIIERASALKPLVYTADNLLVDIDAPVVGEGFEVATERPVWPSGFEPMPAEDVRAHHLQTVGARPADRTPHDERVLQNAREGTGSFIGSEDAVGGYPDLGSTERALDPPAPGQGLGSWLAQHTRAVELGEQPP